MAEVTNLLTGSIKPINYKLVFKPDFNKFTYMGDEEIEVNISKSTDRIAVNCREIAIKEAMVESGKKSYSVKLKYNKLNETVELGLPKKIKGGAVIKIKFIGSNNDKMYGFYRSSYTYNGRQEYMLSSQFEAGDARAAFPCFDQPDMKATFDISFLIPKEFDAISNMPQKSVVNKGANKIVSFRRTPLMSTYLVYLGVGKFDYVNGSLGDLPIRVVTQKGKKPYASMALEYCRKFVDFYANYFGIPYPMPKLDLITVPDFSAGAMENWGAITFRDTVIFGDENSSAVTKERISITVAHELAHQWFGDLVTMKWWDDLWLNESFATFMSYKAVSATIKSIGAEDQFYENEFKNAMYYDQFRATHPISVKVSSPGQISSLFDSISYEKGASVLAMLENYLGEKHFREGLHNYLNSFKYSNAAKEDLWKSLEDESGKRGSSKEVKEMMKSWITKAGYPEVIVGPASLSSESNETLIRVSQKRFIMAGSHDSNSKGTWKIPIKYALVDKKKTSESLFILDRKEGSLKAIGIGAIKLNFGQKGIYRVYYEGELLSRIGELIRNKELSDIDAWGVLDDLYNYVRAGSIKLNIYLHFIERYAMDVGYPANNRIIDSLNSLYTVLYADNGADDVRVLLLDYLKKQFKRYSWDYTPTNNTDEIFKLNVICNLGMLGYAPVVKKARAYYKDLLKGKLGGLHGNLTFAVYSTVAFNGGKKEFDEMLGMYLREKVTEEKFKMLVSLGLFKDISLQEKALSISYSNNVRLQDSLQIPQVISGNITSNSLKHFIANPYGKKIIWRWIKENWSIIRNAYPENSSYWSGLLKVLETVSDPIVLEDVVDFFRTNKPSDVMRPQLAKSVEFMKANIKLFNEYRAKDTH
ncbi:M1 family metallopeptidase [Candidatus Mancarchaeum acidiphilum]|nr:M1 family metallopeptidase [Candidatus Mancarchaeum acidiphilum]